MRNSLCPCSKGIGLSTHLQITIFCLQHMVARNETCRVVDARFCSVTIVRILSGVVAPRTQSVPALPRPPSPVLFEAAFPPYSRGMPPLPVPSERTLGGCCRRPRALQRSQLDRDSSPPHPRGRVSCALQTSRLPCICDAIFLGLVESERDAINCLAKLYTSQTQFMWYHGLGETVHSL